MMKLKSFADMNGSLLQILNIVGESWILLIICDANLGVTPRYCFPRLIDLYLARNCNTSQGCSTFRDEIQNKKNPAKAGFLSDFGRDNFGRTLHCLVYPPNLSARVESMTKV